MPPRSAEASLGVHATTRARSRRARIASIVGRYYAMDRDKRWDRVERGLRPAGRRRAPFTAATAGPALDAAYARGENDEFVKPTAIAGRRRPAARDGRRRRGGVHELPRRPRARRSPARSPTRRSPAFVRARVPSSARYVCLTSTAPTSRICPSRSRRRSRNGFGEYLAKLGHSAAAHRRDREVCARHVLLQRRRERRYPGEDRILVPSPKVATYDLQPEMSAPEVTDKLVAAIAWQIRRHRLQLRQRRHGRPHRQSSTPRGARWRPWTPAWARRRGRARRRRRGADHRRPRQRRDDARPGTGQPHTAHTLNPVRSLLCRAPGDGRRPAPRSRTSPRRCCRCWACRIRRK